MAKKNVKQSSSPRTGWLRLSLELIAVFVGITAGFFVNNYQESRRDQKLDLMLDIDSINHNLLSQLTMNMR